ncbi:MAG: FixH family protein [Gaiellaceae bacterium]
MADATHLLHRWRLRLVLGAAVAAAAVGGVAVAAATDTSGATGAPTISVAPAASAEVRPTSFARVYRVDAFWIELHVSPNSASRAGIYSVRVVRSGAPVNRATVKVTLTMVDMAMGTLSALLPQTSPGWYRKPGPILGMDGRWRIALEVTPREGRTVHLAVIDPVAA